MGWAHVDRVLNFIAGLVGRLVVENLDLAALGNTEVIGRLEFTHGVTLAQIEIDSDFEASVTTHLITYLDYFARLR